MLTGPVAELERFLDRGLIPMLILSERRPHATRRAIGCLAGRGGFEPPEGLKIPHPLSRRALSASQPPPQAGPVYVVSGSRPSKIRPLPWTEAGHVVVLMGVNTTARTLEFSDPLAGSYDGTTMAPLARTLTIYGDMAIVIERVARASAPHARVRHVVATTHYAAPAAPIPTPRLARWAPTHHAAADAALTLLMRKRRLRCAG